MFSKLFLMRSQASKLLGILPPLTPTEDWRGIRVLLFLILTSSAFAQPFPPDSVWTFGFDDGGDEYFYDAIEVSDGYLLCGEAREWNAMAGEALLVKIDRNGELVWARTYPSEGFRRFKDLGGWPTDPYISGEIVNPSGVGIQFFVVGLSADLDSIEWTFFESASGSNLRFGSFTRLADDIRVCYSERNESGQTLLRSYLRPGLNEDRFSVDTSSISFEVMGSENFSHPLIDPIFYGYGEVADDFGRQGIVHFASDGGSGSTFHLGGAGSERFLGAMRITISELVLTGSTTTDSYGSSDAWIVLADTNGSTIWSHHYGGLAYEDGVEIVDADDEGFIIAGNFSSEDIEFEQSDFWLLKVDEDGDSVWSVVKGGDEADRCEGMIQTENGFLLFGSSQSFAVPGWDGCAMLLAYVPDIAATPGSLNFGPVAVGDSSTRMLGLLNTGSNVLTVTGVSSTENYHTSFAGPATVEIGDTLLVPVVFAPQSPGTHVDTLRVSSDALSGQKIVRCLGAGTGTAADDASLLPTKFKLHPPYPNPFNASTVIRFELPKTELVKLNLFDVTGRLVREVARQTFDAGEHRIAIDGAELASGIYFAVMNTGDNYAVQKLLLVR